MKSSTSFVLAIALAACATEKVGEIDPDAIDAIDINEGKDDSLRFPTVKGTLGMGESANGRVTPLHSYHAYDFTYEGTPGLVRLDAKSTAGKDLALAAYRRTSNRWVLADWNDDCGDGSLNSCIALPSTAGKYRFVVTTFDALVGSPISANYQFSISCKDGGCLPAAEVACGARAGDSCQPDQYCKFELGAICGHADGQGVCAAIPQVCTANYSPVCGCDGATYSNECVAAAADTGVLHDGACP